MMNIRFRPIEPEDLDTLYNVENDMRLWSVGYSNVPYSRYILREYIANSTCDIYADRQVRLIAENENGEIVGIADITNFEPKHNRAELGLVVLDKFRKMGYGNVMTRKVIEYCTKIIHLHQLYVVISADNEASLHLFNSLGFEISHELKDWLFDGEKYSNALFLQLFL